MQEMVQEVTFFVHEDYNTQTFDSCKSVLNPATGVPALKMLCGPWGTTLCTPERWFQYMGSIKNGFSPFNILYRFGTDDSEIADEGFSYFNPQVTSCDQGVRVSGNQSNNYRIAFLSYGILSRL